MWTSHNILNTRSNAQTQPTSSFGSQRVGGNIVSNQTNNPSIEKKQMEVMPLAEKIGEKLSAENTNGVPYNSSLNNFKNKFEDELNSQKLNNLQSKANTFGTKNGKNLSQAQKVDFAKVARGFESMFINMMFKGLKSAMLEEKKGDSFGANTLEGYTDMAFSDQLANSGSGIGIADMIYQNFTGEKLSGIKNLSPEQYQKLIQNLKPEAKVRSENLSQVTKDIQNQTKINNPGQSSTTKDLFSQNNSLLPLEQRLQTENLVDTFIPTSSSSLNDRLDSFSGYISEASEKFGIDPNLIKSVIAAESYGKHNAVSAAGAKGLMQLMDNTAKGLGVVNSFDPKQNILGGTKYIKQMMDKYDSDLSLVLSAYNAGPGNVDKYNGIPPFKETQTYVNRVKHYLNQFGGLSNQPSPFDTNNDTNDNNDLLF